MTPAFLMGVVTALSATIGLKLFIDLVKWWVTERTNRKHLKWAVWMNALAKADREDAVRRMRESRDD